MQRASASRPRPAPGLVWLFITLLGCHLLSPAVAGEPLQLAIVNQVFFHLEVVAGAMHVLRDFSSAPLTVYLHEKVMNTDWYGFKSWMGTQQGVVWKDCKDYDGKKQYDVVWFVSPEYHLPWVAARVAEMKPKVALQMVHNGHIKDEDMQKVLKLTSGSTVYTLAPHVAKYITNRTKAPTEWILPIFPYTPANVCALADLQAGRQCLKGFSVQGRIEKSRRNYTAMWEQMTDYRKQHGNLAVSNFRLNILGESVEAFNVPDPVKDLVAVYKNPPYPIFYDVVHHSFGLVPMLANPQYYKSKFSSTVLTSLITGVPMIADEPFVEAYGFIDKAALYLQGENENELDVMFRVARSDPQEMWRTRTATATLRNTMNARVRDLLTQMMRSKGLEPDAKSVAAGGPGHATASTGGAGGTPTRKHSRRRRQLMGVPQEAAAAGSSSSSSSGRGSRAAVVRRLLGWVLPHHPDQGTVHR